MPAALLLLALSAPGATPASPGPGAYGNAYASGCIASLREFAYELSSAVELGDVNRLAALYRWRGVSTRTGYSIMERLQVLAGRPLLQVDPVYPASRPAPLAPPAITEAPGTGGLAAPASASAPAASSAPAYAAFPPDGLPAFDPLLLERPLHGPPVGLRLRQMLEDGSTAVSTTLWLRRELGCWWVTL